MPSTFESSENLGRVSSTQVSSKPGLVRLLFKALFALLCLSIVGFSAYKYGFHPLGFAMHPVMAESFRAHGTGIYLHIFGAGLALFLSPFQLSQRLRQRIGWHRWLGRAYLALGVLVGGSAGLYVAQFAFGGLVARMGFSMLSICWLISDAMAYLRIRQGDVAGHKRWMIRNVSMTFAAVTLRIYLGAFFAMGMQFDEFYPLVSWLAWVPNLIIAEWYFNAVSMRKR